MAGRPPSASLPVGVRRAGRLLCRTDTRTVDLNARHVLDNNNNNNNTFTLLVTTDAEVNMTVKISVLLESNLTQWQQIKGRR